MSEPKILVRPTETECPVCHKIFLQPVRKQGGGKRTIYCSHACTSLDWVRGNGGKRKAAVLKYDSKPENKEKKRIRQKGYKLKKYGWSQADIERELKRQNYSCYGCLERIDYLSAQIDHCHVTNKTRGLLCRHCNWAIGHLRDNPATLRRLMAYLDHDRTKRAIYLIGALKNKRIPLIGNMLRQLDYDVMDEWCTPGEFADINWQEYEKLRGRTYAEALRGRAATNTFLFDRSYLDLADIAILCMPAGKSAMIELGYAKGRGKQTYIFLDGCDPERYDIMPGFADKIFNTEEELVGFLAKPPSLNGESYSSEIESL